jgi:hypothetical protein
MSAQFSNAFEIWARFQGWDVHPDKGVHFIVCDGDVHFSWRSRFFLGVHDFFSAFTMYRAVVDVGAVVQVCLGGSINTAKACIDDVY